MKLLVDLIACQTSSRNRGVGRYTLELTRSLARERGDSQVVCMADPLFPEGFEELRQDFIRQLPAGSFLPYFHEQIPEVASIQDDRYTQLAAALISQARVAVSPDLVLTPSLFEGWDVPGAVVPIPQATSLIYKQAVILHDLNLLVYHGQDLDSNLLYKEWYLQRINSLRNFDLLLTTSETTRQDAINTLDLQSERVVNISGAAPPQFRRLDFLENEKIEILHRLGITRPFVFCQAVNDFQSGVENILQAFARLPKQQSESFQIVINDVNDKTEILKQARSLGFRDDDLVVISNSSDDERVKLYNLCTVYIFPSIDKSPGLSVLEAMACSAPVLVANNSFLLEMVGRADMLFDADIPKSIEAALAQVLTDTIFREDLSRYGVERAKQFSWEKSARLAWQAMENTQKDSQRPKVFANVKAKTSLPRVAYVSPLPPQQSGISEYSAELLPYLSKYFEIDLFVEPGLDLKNNERLKHFPTHPWSELLDRRDEFATVVYHYGNSMFHAHMFELERQFPGVVVLHDFYLSGLVDNLYSPNNAFLHEVDYSHGLKGLIDFQAKGIQAVWDWPINWQVLRQTNELIVHSPFQKQLLDKFYFTGWQPRLNIISQMHNVERAVSEKEQKSARRRLGLNPDTFVFCSFGFLGPIKFNDSTIEAFLLAQQSFDKDCKLIFVGDFADPGYQSKLAGLLHDLNLKDKVQITGFVSDENFRDYLLAANAAIQLRKNSRGETSRAVLDCMAYGLPVIVNANGTLNDYRTEDVVRIADPVEVKELSQQMARLQADDVYRLDKGRNARNTISANHSPKATAAAYAEVIERAIEEDSRVILRPAMVALEEPGFPAGLVKSQATHAAKNFGLRNRPRILVDVSETANNDIRTGIQRVVKRVVVEWLKITDPSLLIEIVHLSMSNNSLYRANSFVETNLDLPAGSLGEDKLISISPGDTLIMLDASWAIYRLYLPIFEQVRKAGGKIVTMIYDLIPIRFPQFCDKYTPGLFPPWLRSVFNESDKIVCISETVAKDVASYRNENKIGMGRNLDINFFHLGADIPIISNELSVRPEVGNFVRALSSHLFLSISTIEPRKGFGFVLDAFESLWQQGDASVLVFAGKIGWNISELEARIRNHSMLNKKFFFFENPTDAELEILFSKATALIAASIAEGFGLPIVEAAKHNIPTLVSDIPVFHEIGGEGTIYFSTNSQASLVDAIRFVAGLSADQRLDLAKKIKVLSWKESALWLLDIVNEKCND